MTTEPTVFEVQHLADAILLHTVDSEAVTKEYFEEHGTIAAASGRFERDAVRALVADALDRGITPADLVLELAQRAVWFASELLDRRPLIAESVLSSAQAAAIADTVREDTPDDGD